MIRLYQIVSNLVCNVSYRLLYLYFIYVQHRSLQGFDLFHDKYQSRGGPRRLRHQYHGWPILDRAQPVGNELGHVWIHPDGAQRQPVQHQLGTGLRQNCLGNFCLGRYCRFEDEKKIFLTINEIVEF